MKKFILFSISAVMMLAASCQKSTVANEQTQEGGEGVLSFANLVLDLDDAVDTKATSSLAPAQNYYQIAIVDADGQTCLTKSYKEIKESDNRITLPAGNYTLEVSSSDETVPDVDWEYPVYGASKEFTIVAGEATEIGEITCTLTQCKVTVDYSPEFLDCVTGAGKTTVTIKTGHPLEYTMTSAGKYEKRAGYFLVDESSTMTVVFQGSIDGKNKKMTKAFYNIAPKQWRQVKFIQKVNEQGNATFDIVINPLVSDEVLNGDLTASSETIIADDPDAPKGDGGITIYPDYEAGCDAEISDLSNLLIVPKSERAMAIKLKAECPNGIRKFDVAISTDNSGFAAAVAAADATNLNLISPSEQNAIIFDVVPFPHGEELIGQTSVPFDLSNAQDAILMYQGHHTFTMTIVDAQGLRKSIEVTMVVE